MPKQSNTVSSLNKDTSSQIEEIESAEEHISLTYDETVQLMLDGQSESPNASIEAISPNRRIVSCYASLVDPNEGTSLKFIQAPLVNGVLCAKIESNDINPEIAYWQSAMLCSILRSKPPLEVIEGFIRRIWQAFNIDKICLVRKGVYLVRSNSVNDQMTVVQRGVYFFDKKPFRVKAWNQEMDLSIESILPI